MQRADRRWLSRETTVFLGILGSLFLATLLLIDAYLPVVFAVLSMLLSARFSDLVAFGWAGLRGLAALALWVLGLAALALQARRWGTAVRALRRKYRSRATRRAPVGGEEMRTVMRAPSVARADEARRPGAPSPRH